jgi:Sulfotransferase family
LQQPSQRINQKICFIAGTGHSGSTLLGLLLGNHSSSFFCGEGKKSLYLQKENAPAHKRFCKFCGADCPIWSDLLLTPELDLYEALAQQIWHKQQQRSTLMIDSSSGIDWIQRQWQTVTTSAQPYLIFLQRDGRAVVNSYRRKYPERDLSEIIQNWRNKIQQTQELFDEFRGAKLIVHYEELALHTDIVLERLCEFLGIAYEPEMRNFGNAEYHVLGGNNGTQYLVAHRQAQTHPDKAQQFLSRMAAPNRQHYQTHNADIVLDVRWQTELSDAQQTLFEQLVGDLNQAFVWSP